MRNECRPTAPAAPWLSLSWRRHDNHRAITALSAMGLLAGAAMAVFGLPPVDLHGPLHWIGVMSPLCGGTRAARFAARGDWSDAWRYNPLGILAVIAAAIGALRSIIGLGWHRWASFTVQWSPWRRRIAVVLIVAALIALTVRQQLRADLLMAGPV